jgi:hypothetical protein
MVVVTAWTLSLPLSEIRTEKVQVPTVHDGREVTCDTSGSCLQELAYVTVTPLVLLACNNWHMSGSCLQELAYVTATRLLLVWNTWCKPIRHTCSSL